MAPQLTDAEVQVLISCIKHSSTKLTPNYDEVGKECNFTGERAAYFKHYHIMKKLGLNGARSQGAEKRKKKFARGKKRAAVAMEEDGDMDVEEDKDEDEDDEDDEKPAKTAAKKSKKVA